MDDANFKSLAIKELSSMKAGIDITAAAVGQIRRDALHPALQAALEKGGRAVSEWDYRIGHAIQEIGSAARGGNPVLLSHYETSRQYREEAANPLTRDLAIVTSGQFALQYWLTAFATMAQYASRLGFNAVAWDMTMSAEEAKAAGERQALLADELLQQEPV